MLVLVLDSATESVTTALAEVGEDAVTLLAQRQASGARAHGELLAPAVAEVLAEAAVRVTGLGALVAGLGPGPFTGLRVGLVTAVALGQTLNIPTYGVCSLDAIGAGLPGRALVATDARRREVYWAVYADGKRVSDPAVAAPADAADQAAALGVEYAVGEGALRYADVLRLPVRDEPRYPSAQALAELAADRVRAGAPGERLTPLYLRRPDAAAPGARKAVLQR